MPWRWRSHKQRGALFRRAFKTGGPGEKEESCCLCLTIAVIGGVAGVCPAQKAPAVPSAIIVPPDPSLPDEVKALSGTWTGRWNSRWDWDCTLYVEKIDKDSAQVVHSWGEYDTSGRSCHCAPDWRRVRRAKVTCSGGQATIEFVARPCRPLDESHPSHEVSGSVDPSKKRYTFWLRIDKKNEPTLMKGHFISGNASQLRIEMRRID